MKKIFLVCLFLSSCASLKEAQKQHLESICNYEGAYSLGVNDAREAKPSTAVEQFSQCPSDSKIKAMSGYNDGYASIANPEESMTDVVGQVLKSTGVIKELYRCEIDVFNKTFSGQGKTIDNAFYTAKDNCVAGRNGDDFFCKKETNTAAPNFINKMKLLFLEP